MKFYAILENERIVQGVALDEKSLAATQETLTDSQTVIESDFMVDPDKHYWDGQSVCQKPDLPGPEFFWNEESLSYEYDIVSGFFFLRRERNAKLDETDWTQMPDTPVDQAAWATYRQALRDLPENTDDPRNVVWPSPPG